MFIDIYICTNHWHLETHTFWFLCHDPDKCGDPGLLYGTSCVCAVLHCCHTLTKLSIVPNQGVLKQ